MAGGHHHVNHLCRWPKFARGRHSAMDIFCRWVDFAASVVLGKGHFLSTAGLCRERGPRQRLICWVQCFAGCLWVWPLAKKSFAECLINSSRQSILHLANHLLPVVRSGGVTDLTAPHKLSDSHTLDSHRRYM